MWITLAIAVVITAIYGNIGYDLTSKELAKSRKKGWEKFNSSWWWMMLYLPITTFIAGAGKLAILPARIRHKKRIKEVEAQIELDAEEDPRLLEEGKEGAERAAKGIPDPEEQKPEHPSGLGEVLNPKVLAPKEPPDK